MAREFKSDDGSTHPIQKMKCQWNREWDPTHELTVSNYGILMYSVTPYITNGFVTRKL